MKASQKSFYVYLQHPASGQWQTVGLYQRDPASTTGSFTYTDEYAHSKGALSIDPVNLPIWAGKQKPIVAERYGGLHDVLRDSGPDGWGQYLLTKFAGLSHQASALDYLLHSKNSDRWGALAIGSQKLPPSKLLDSPEIPSLDVLVKELAAMEEGKAAIDPKLRKRLQEYSGGGVRPKATLRDKLGNYWIAKPRSRLDPLETPVIEYFCHRWAESVGITSATTRLETTESGHSLALIQRFDRCSQKRRMCLSAASVMGIEYPGGSTTDRLRPSYPYFASKLQSIGVPREDRKELFDRMVFNALCGNDDDHTRNHAIVFDFENNVWRLSPAYDIVPRYDEQVKVLAMAVSLTDKVVSRKNVLSGYGYFGFASEQQASERVEHLVQLARERFQEVSSVLSRDTQSLALLQLDYASRILQANS